MPIDSSLSWLTWIIQKYLHVVFVGPYRSSLYSPTSHFLLYTRPGSPLPQAHRSKVKISFHIQNKTVIQHLLFLSLLSNTKALLTLPNSVPAFSDKVSNLNSSRRNKLMLSGSQQFGHRSSMAKFYLTLGTVNFVFQRRSQSAGPRQVMFPWKPHCTRSSTRIFESCPFDHDCFSSRLIPGHRRRAGSGTVSLAGQGAAFIARPPLSGIQQNDLGRDPSSRSVAHLYQQRPLSCTIPPIAAFHSAAAIRRHTPDAWWVTEVVTVQRQRPWAVLNTQGMPLSQRWHVSWAGRGVLPRCIRLTITAPRAFRHGVHSPGSLGRACGIGRTGITWHLTKRGSSQWAVEILAVLTPRSVTSPHSS